MAPATRITHIEGGIAAVGGIACAGVWAGFRKRPGQRDLAVVAAPQGAAAAGVFTQNTFCAAPVTVSREHLEQLRAAHDPCFAVVVNSGNANAATGAPGEQAARATAALAAQGLGCRPHQVLVASTGVIGVNLPEGRFEAGLPQALASLGATDGTDAGSGLAAAEAIMTTDTKPKLSAAKVEVTLDDGTELVCTVGGICKGSGMIAPDMATMIAILATDAPLTVEAADEALRVAAGVSFNKVTIDSDTSTNDTAILLATGAASGGHAAGHFDAGDAAACPSPPACPHAITPASACFDDLQAALCSVCEDLARQIAQDGEGATKLVTVELRGAADETDADCAARAVADSPLVKTALAGHDANWGRIAMALGKSGAEFRQEDVCISIMGLPVCRHGLPVPFDEDEALRRFEQLDEIVIEADLGAGEASTRIWTCDLTHEYISINGDYRT
ncbi:MAG: bifunctional glutamate N-acetyltransferase/amino-acid acetyltransferase ArgJ [Coriobacteriales bacterium]|nr:bifunctional glutamate N-acetyltransferase/amino-acid acetyltransferase ArgJ [Coriobacteriales bacterium]